MKSHFDVHDDVGLCNSSTDNIEAFYSLDDCIELLNYEDDWSNQMSEKEFHLYFWKLFFTEYRILDWWIFKFQFFKSVAPLPFGFSVYEKSAVILCSSVLNMSFSTGFFLKIFSIIGFKQFDNMTVILFMLLELGVCWASVVLVFIRFGKLQPICLRIIFQSFTFPLALLRSY